MTDPLLPGQQLSRYWLTTDIEVMVLEFENRP